MPRPHSTAPARPAPTRVVSARAALAAAALAVTALVTACGGDDSAATPAPAVEQLPNGMRLVTDPVVQRFVTELGLAIARHTSRPDVSWRFYVIDDPQVNAFARPDGAVFVNSGLIARADRLDELAGVLGHEIGHVVEGHAVAEAEKGVATNVGVSLFCRYTELCTDRGSQAVVGAAASALQAHFSRADEAAADSEAIVNVMRAGIDPEGVPAMLENLLAARQQSPTIVDEFFSSHPLEEDRIRHTQHLLDAIPDDSVLGAIQDTPEFHAFKARLCGGRDVRC